MDWKRLTSAATVAALALGGIAATAVGAPVGLAADMGDPLAAAGEAYRKSYPGLSATAARTAAAQQQLRKDLYTALTKDGDAVFGGAWFDARSGVSHVAVTSDAGAERVTELGKRFSIRTSTIRVRRSFSELQRQADAIRGGSDALSTAAQGRVGIDVHTNEVVVATTGPTALAAPAGVKVVAQPETQIQRDAACTSRNACDWTIRAGSALWRGANGNVCSVGFTGRNASNQRFTLTAGHCSDGAGVTWGTGGQTIGPMGAAAVSGSLDAGLITVTNGWFTGDAGGEIYHENGPGRSVPLNGVAPTLGYIWPGDVTCLSANFTEPNGPNYCGTIGSVSDATAFGMTRVDNVDACGGDSGGGWYWLTSTGARIGYGVHSMSTVGCHAHTGNSSWFSPLPTIKSWAPWLNIETR